MNYRKRLEAGILVLLAFVILFGISNCAKYDDLSDQNPMLVVRLDLLNAPPGKPDETNKMFLIYYHGSDWTEPWLTQSTTGTEFFNPVVLSYSSTYLAVFYDADGTGTLSTGDRYIGYSGVTFPSTLTQITFFPREIKLINITFDFAAPPFP